MHETFTTYHEDNDASITRSNPLHGNWMPQRQATFVPWGLLYVFFSSDGPSYYDVPAERFY